MAENNTSLAWEYFLQFTNKESGAALLWSIPDEEPKRFESELLEFKNGRHEKNFDEGLSKELGAFANSDGGVIIWGITADRDNDAKLDYAHSRSPVPDVEALKGKVLSKYRLLTDPPLNGVMVEALHVEESKPEGFVVMFIPRGEQQPYKSLKASYPYLWRVGGDALPISNAHLRQLFYPKHSARVQIEIYPLSTISKVLSIPQGIVAVSQYKTAVVFGIRITNSGNTSIRKPFFSMVTKKTLLLRTDVPSSEHQVNARQANELVALDEILHPNMTAPFYMLALSMEPIIEIPLRVNIYSSDAPSLTAAITLPANFTTPITTECIPN